MASISAIGQLLDGAGHGVCLPFYSLVFVRSWPWSSCSWLLCTDRCGGFC